MVKITLHGDLGEKIGKEWILDVESVNEGINAIDILSENKLYKYLQQKEQAQSPYRVLINGEDFISEEKLDDIKKPENVRNSNLIIKINNLKTIDIIPIIEGAGKIGNIIFGVILIIVGIILFATGYGAGFGVLAITTGLGLIVTGVLGLLARPPDFEDPNGVGKSSYLFNGPQNVVREGGPVPIGYGRLLLGSQVIAASYDIYDVSSVEQVISDDIRSETSNPGGVAEMPTQLIQT